MKIGQGQSKHALIDNSSTLPFRRRTVLRAMTCSLFGLVSCTRTRSGIVSLAYTSAARDIFTSDSYLVTSTEFHNDLHAIVASSSVPQSHNFDLVAKLAKAGDLAINRNQNLQRITTDLAQPITLDSSLLAQVAELARYKDQNNVLGIDSDAWARRIGLGAQSAASIASRFLPEFNWALALAAIWVEPTLNYLAEPGLNLAVSPFPPTPPSRVDLLTQMALYQAFSAADTNGDFKLALNLPQVHGPVNLEVSATNANLISKLPDSWQGVAADTSRMISATQQSTPADTAEIGASIQNKMTAAFDKLGRKYDSLKAALQQAQTDAARAEVRQQQREEIARTDAEMAGTVSIAGFLANRVFGDPATARQITEGGNAVRQVYESVARYAIGDIGILALSGGLLQAANVVLNLLMPAEDPVIVALRSLGTQLHQIQQQLSLIEQKEDQILTALAELYGSFNLLRQTTLVKFDQLAKMISLDATADRQGKRDQDFGQLQEAVAQVKRLLRSTRLNAEAFAEYLTDIYSYTVNSAAASYYTGSVIDADTIDVLLPQEGRVDLYFGAIPGVCGKAQIWFPAEHQRSGGFAAVPNPIAWSFGSRVYLQMRAAAPESATSRVTDADQLNDIWQQGLRVREAAQIVSSRESLQALTGLFRQYAGINQDHAVQVNETVLERVNHLVASVVADIGAFRGFTAVQVSAVPLRPLVYWMGVPGGGYRNYEVSYDPVQYAIENDLLRTEVAHAGRNDAGSGTVYQRLIVSQGQRAGQELLTDVLMLEQWSSNGQETHRFRTFVKNATFSEPVDLFERSQNLLPLVLNEAEKLIRLVKEWPLIRSKLIQKIGDDITEAQTNDPYRGFFWALGACSLAATIAKWRRTPDTVQVPNAPQLDNIAAHLGNTSIPVTVSDYQNSLPVILAEAPSDEAFQPDVRVVEEIVVAVVVSEFQWGQVVHDRFAKVLQATADALASEANDLVAEQGIPEVDEALKMLAGYMRIRNIQFQLPVPSGANHRT